jgi:hypothetical protein
MSAEKLYSEILEEFSTCTTKQERISVLKKYDHPRFRTFLQAVFHPKIKFNVDIPKYRPAEEPAGMNYTYLDLEMPKLYRFVENHPSKPEGLTKERQKQLLLVILESLHKDEAELMIKMFKKNIEVKFLTPTLVEEVFPNILK